MNNLLFTSFLVAGGDDAVACRAVRASSISSIRTRATTCCSRCSRIRCGERVGAGDAVLSVLRDVTDLRRAANELERQVQRVRQAEFEVAASAIA